MAEYAGSVGKVSVDHFGESVVGGPRDEPPLPEWHNRNCTVSYERAEGWTRRTCVLWEHGRVEVPAWVGCRSDPEKVVRVSRTSFVLSPLPGVFAVSNGRVWTRISRRKFESMLRLAVVAKKKAQENKERRAALEPTAV